MNQHMNFMIESCKLNVLTIKQNIKNNSDIYRAPNKAKEKQFIYGLRKDTYMIKGHLKVFHRVFVKCENSGKYSYLGWVIDEDANVCMICQQSFFGIVTTGKHHCRACGIVICDKCSVTKISVSPIEEHGPLRVCSLCFYDQTPVEAQFNYNQGLQIAGNFYNPQEHEVVDFYHEMKLSELIDKKDFGPIYLVPITPAFVLKGYHQVLNERFKVFVNITSSSYVPYNNKIVVGNEKLIFMNVGELGKSYSGAKVVDVCVNPMVIDESYRNADLFRQLCEQALLAAEMHVIYDQFDSYHVIPSPQLRQALLGTPNEGVLKETPPPVPPAAKESSPHSEKEAEEAATITPAPKKVVDEKEFDELNTNYVERCPITFDAKDPTSIKPFVMQHPGYFTNQGVPQYHVRSKYRKIKNSTIPPLLCGDLVVNTTDLYRDVLVMPLPLPRTFDILYTFQTSILDVTLLEGQQLITILAESDGTGNYKRRLTPEELKALEAQKRESGIFTWLFGSSKKQGKKEEGSSSSSSGNGDGSSGDKEGNHQPSEESKQGEASQAAGDSPTTSQPVDLIGENVVEVDEHGNFITTTTTSSAATVGAGAGIAVANGNGFIASETIEVEEVEEEKEDEDHLHPGEGFNKQASMIVHNSEEGVEAKEDDAQLSIHHEQYVAYREKVCNQLYNTCDPSQSNQGKVVSSTENTIGDRGNSSEGNPMGMDGGQILGAKPNPGPPRSFQRKRVMLKPYPGFVIKTHLAGKPEEKVFINVYHHHHLDDLVQREHITLLSPDDLFVLVGESVHQVLDKQQKPSDLYHVVVSSTYFQQSYLDEPIVITKPEGIFRILEVVNDRYELQLDTKNYILPRVKGGFKGEEIPADMIYSFLRRVVVSHSPNCGHRSTSPPPLTDRLSTTEDAHNNDTASVGSESNNPIYSNPTVNKGNRHIVTEDMLTFQPKLNIDWQDIVVLKNYSLEKPEILLGWQISVNKRINSSPEIYVVTGIRKSTMRKTQYCLSHTTKPDLWTSLKRSAEKSGLLFQPTRKVYNPDLASPVKK